jgi:hypothetical protein
VPIQHLEPIVRAVDLHLKDRLDENVAAVNAYWGDEPVITVPAADAFFPGGFAVLKYPAIEYAVPDFDLLNLPLGSPPPKADLEATLAMRAWVQDVRVEPGRLYYRALRFGQAILRTMFEPGAFGAGVQMEKDRPVRGAYRFNPEAESRDEVTAALVLVFSLEAVEPIV